MTTLNPSNQNIQIPPIIKSTPEKKRELHPLYLKKINEGKEPVLPHQENSLKPEEIIEPLEEPLEEYISPSIKEEAEINHRNQQAYKELKQMEKKRLTKLLTTTQKIKNNLKKLQNTLTNT